MSRRRYTVAIDHETYRLDVLETAADRFEVSVDGRTYEAILLEDHDLPGSAISPEVAPPVARDEAVPADLAVQPRPAAPAETRPVSPIAAWGAPPRHPGASGAGPASIAPTGAPVVDDDGGVVASPLPGVVLEVFVSAGTSVRRGDALLVLEAMKMRNMIRAPRDAVVREVAVAAGQPVGPGDVLVRLGGTAG